MFGYWDSGLIRASYEIRVCCLLWFSIIWPLSVALLWLHDVLHLLLQSRRSLGLNRKDFTLQVFTEYEDSLGLRKDYFLQCMIWSLFCFQPNKHLFLLLICPCWEFSGFIRYQQVFYSNQEVKAYERVLRDTVGVNNFMFYTFVPSSESHFYIFFGSKTYTLRFCFCSLALLESVVPECKSYNNHFVPFYGILLSKSIHLMRTCQIIYTEKTTIGSDMLISIRYEDIWIN